MPLFYTRRFFPARVLAGVFGAASCSAGVTTESAMGVMLRGNTVDSGKTVASDKRMYYDVDSGRYVWSDTENASSRTRTNETFTEDPGENFGNDDVSPEAVKEVRGANAREHVQQNSFPLPRLLSLKNENARQPRLLKCTWDESRPNFQNDQALMLVNYVRRQICDARKQLKATYAKKTLSPYLALAKKNAIGTRFAKIFGGGNKIAKAEDWLKDKKAKEKELFRAIEQAQIKELRAWDNFLGPFRPEDEELFDVHGRRAVDPDEWSERSMELDVQRLPWVYALEDLRAAWWDFEYGYKALHKAIVQEDPCMPANQRISSADLVDPYAVSPSNAYRREALCVNAGITKFGSGVFPNGEFWDPEMVAAPM